MDDTKKISPPFHYWKARLYVGIVMLILSFFGLIVTELKQDGAWYYWRCLCVVFAALSIGLHLYLRKREQVSFLGTIWDEIFHWLGLFLAVIIISVMVEVGIIGRFLSSITVLMLLALTTYLAGIYMEITLVFVGLLLGALALGLSIVSAYLYPIVIPITALLGISLWIYLKRKYLHHKEKL